LSSCETHHGLRFAAMAMTGAKLDDGFRKGILRCSVDVRETMTEAAEAEVLNRTIVTIPAKDWDAFEAWISRPAKIDPGAQEACAGDAILGTMMAAASAGL
jgi:hypothetical protein